MRTTGCDTTLTRVFHSPVILSHVFVAFNVDFTSEHRAMTRPVQIIKFTTFYNCRYAWNEARKIRIPPKQEDRMRKRNIADFRKIKKTTKINLGTSSSQSVGDEDEDSFDDDGSYDPSTEDAPPPVPIDAFQAEIWAAFEQLYLTHFIHGTQLVEIMESYSRYADEIAHHWASMDRQEVMLARLCHRFLPNWAAVEGMLQILVHNEGVRIIQEESKQKPIDDGRLPLSSTIGPRHSKENLDKTLPYALNISYSCLRYPLKLKPMKGNENGQKRSENDENGIVNNKIANLSRELSSNCVCLQFNCHEIRLITMLSGIEKEE
ncbi:hypothetical protein M9H77_29735 [Catharanthus roseus]|uniref:Uncharacterized protein n=1 Tax=Catharanthus roseus TaxID=4058 RepID=A0ACB9ZXG4_CATRO|nr:hypothetical protein M9H77_29735 [Catharanthus roseus]